MENSPTSNDEIAQARYRHSGNVASREIAGEMLLVPIKTKTGAKTGIYMLNPTAAMIWNLLDGKRTVQELVQSVANEFEEDPNLVMHDTGVFISDLLSFDAIVQVGEG